MDREVTRIFVEKKSLIAEWVTNYHVEKNISGVVLCDSCHSEEHGRDSFARYCEKWLRFSALRYLRNRCLCLVYNSFC